MNLIVGHAYRAKKPGNAGGYVNDRQLTWIGDVEVQYDSPAVKHGMKYKRMPKQAFLEWAGQDITGTLPDGDWQSWLSYLSAKCE